ncbi:unnamed protein product [Cyclocybe aegerita]|uniref:RRM domain-containing protein n=1 Tax=Cyclocybe aegerita TaxID=1973307 RepID=A0A8S0WLW1_CYCAE|nr:unnamed protein product [Cyclocybe aegerita]
MAPLSTDKKSKRSAKSGSKPKPSVVISSKPESSSKPAKALKRKKEDDNENSSSKERPKASKKAKKDEVPSKKPKKAAKRTVDSDTESVGGMKKTAKTPTPEPEPSASEDEEEGDGDGAKESDEDSDDDQLHGFSTDEDSSDEDDAMDDEPTGLDVGKLPTVAKDDATVKMKLEKAKREPTEDRGVLFLGRLPHGFYEDQLKAYFSQFGDITRLRLSRNKKNGRSKHYGFIEFDSSAVAKIVAETMDNYLLMGHILRCKLIPKDEVHPELWVGANRKWRKVPAARVTRAQQNKLRTEVEQQRATNRLLKRQLERKEKLARAGIKYDFEGAGYRQAKQVKV